MAKVNNPPFGLKQRNLEVQDHWFPPRPVSDRDLQEISDKAAEEAVRAKDSRAGKASGEKRREEPSPAPIIEFIKKKLNRARDISSRDMVAALKAEAKNAHASGGIEMSDDGKAFVVMDNGKVKNRLAIRSVPATLSRLKQKLILTRTGSN
jgi:hypothetical protein